MGTYSCILAVVGLTELFAGWWASKFQIGARDQVGYVNEYVFSVVKSFPL